MKRTLIGSTAALLLAGSTAFATSTVTIYDASRMDFEVKRGVVETVERLYGKTTVFSDPAELPASVNAALVEGSQLPADAPIEPIPSKLIGELPEIENARWVKVGDHIVALDNQNVALMVVYDVLA
ncbi:MAG: hypothetical protein AAF371_01580 [Pseudomonadota bacterium]